MRCRFYITVYVVLKNISLRFSSTFYCKILRYCAKFFYLTLNSRLALYVIIISNLKNAPSLLGNAPSLPSIFLSFQVFDSSGSFISYINTTGDPLYGPQGVSITNDGCVVVADSGNHCVKMYRYLQ